MRVNVRVRVRVRVRVKLMVSYGFTGIYNLRGRMEFSESGIFTGMI